MQPDDLTKPEEDDKSGLRTPYEAVLNGTAITLGVQLNAGQELFLPWIRFVEAQRLNEDLIILIEDWELRLRFDTDKASAARWQVFAFIDALQDQRLKWIFHAPESGLSVTAIKIEKEETAG